MVGQVVTPTPEVLTSPPSPAMTHTTKHSDDLALDHPGVVVPEATETGGPDASVPTTAAPSLHESPQTGSLPDGLDDQTNFLPTKQVITVFFGLSFSLACAFLDQTM
jgi:hypothetical protein